MNLGQEDARRLLEEMVKVTGLTLSQIARKAGLVPSTLTRFVNNPNVKHTLSLKSAQKAAAGAKLTLVLSVDADRERSLDEARLLTIFRQLSGDHQKSLMIFAEALAQQQPPPATAAPPTPKRGRR